MRASQRASESCCARCAAAADPPSPPLAVRVSAPAPRPLTQVASTLDDEAAADAALRRQYGDRWTAAPSDLVAADLRGDYAKYAKVRARTGACLCVCAHATYAKVRARVSVCAGGVRVCDVKASPQSKR